MGHRAGIKQQNNGELPPLNLLMGSQWLPWLHHWIHLLRRSGQGVHVGGLTWHAAAKRTRRSERVDIQATITKEDQLFGKSSMCFHVGGIHDFLDPPDDGAGL